MRAILSKAVIGSMVAGAALLVSACGGNTETTNTVVTDINATDATMDGTVTDNMTAVDGTLGNDALLANDVAATNDAAPADDAATTNAN